MICPKCKTNLEGGLIFDTLMGMYGDREIALEHAAHYGATETTGHWGREIGIYSLEEDRTTAWRCPECNHVWGRHEEGRHRREA